MTPMAMAIVLGLVAAGNPQDVYDAPPLRSDVGSLYETAIQQLPSSRPDPAVLRQLAIVHASGHGAQRDALNACAFAQLYRVATRLRYYEGHPEDNAAAQLVSQMCDSLARDDRALVGYLMGCPLVGFPTRTIVELEPGWWVTLYERHLVVEHPAGIGQSDFAMFPCGGRMARLIHTVLPPTDNGRSRHVIEALVWLSNATAEGTRRELIWGAVEIRAEKVVMLGRESWWEPGSAWPTAPSIPSALARGARFHVNANGQIDYTIPKSGELTEFRSK